MVGRAAVDYATRGNIDGSVAINRIADGKDYDSEPMLTRLVNVAKNTKSMPDKLINEAGNDVTAAFIQYAKPLAGPLPETGRL